MTSAILSDPHATNAVVAVRHLWVERLLLHVQCGGWVGFAAGALDARFTGSALPLRAMGRLLLSGAGTGAMLGSLIGALLGAAGALASVLASRMGPSKGAAFAGLTLARRASFLVGGALGLATFAYPLAVSERIDTPKLRAIVLVLAAAFAIAVALLAGHLMEAAIARWSARREVPARRWSLPPAARFALFVLAPVLAVGAPLLVSYGEELGSLRRLLLLSGFVAAERSAFLLLHRVASRRIARGLGLLLLAAGIVGGALVLRPASAELSRLGRGVLLPDALALLQRVTDVDADGFSSMYGGRDCAPFTPSRYPGAREVPRNGIDEDCNGVDATSAPQRAEVLPKFSAHTPLDLPRPNVLWVIVDSLRADHLKAFGYALDTSPTLTALSREAWVFERAYSQSSTTALSVASMLAGRNPASMLWTRGIFPDASPDELRLPRVFSEQGYSSGLAINAWIRDHLPGIQLGFDRVLVAPPEVSWRSGDYVLSSILQLTDQARAAGKPFFVVAHVDDVHHPYVAAEGKSVPDFRAAGDKAAYDAGIALFDQSLRVAVEHLRYTGAWEQTVLIVTADHGEEFGEHGGSVHSRTCYSEVTHVPLIVRIPRAGAARIAQRVALIDLAPTLLELLGVRRSQRVLDGQSLLVPALEPSLVDPLRPIFCTICQVLAGRPPFFTHSVRQGPWSFFEDVKLGTAELYDVSRDPGERTNLAGQPARSSTIAELRQLIAREPAGNLLRVSDGLER